MSYFKFIVTLIFFVSINSALFAHKYKRIISVGGGITEIIYQLGEFDKLIASDTSSVYPKAAQKMKKIGYWMRLSSEGILALKPDLLIASSQSQAKQANVYQQIQDAGVPVIQIKDEPSLIGAYAKIRQIAKVLGKEKKGERCYQGFGLRL